MGINFFVIFSLVSTSILGLAKILSIIPFNRMAADDFSFTVSLLGTNIINFVYSWYMSLTARYTANILIGGFGVLSGPSAKPYIFTLLTVLLGIISLAFFIHSLTKIKFFSFKNFLLAAGLLVLFYIITPSQRESWYWMNSAATYVWPAFFDLVIVSLLLKKVKSWWTYLSLFILTFLAGGTNECILVVNFLLSGLTIFYLLTKDNYRLGLKNLFSKVVKKLKKQTPLLKKMWPVFLGATLSLVIIYLSPGNDARMGSPTSSPMSPFGSLAYSFRDGPKLVWEIVKNNIFFLVPFGVVLTYLFSVWFSEKTNLTSKEKWSYVNLILMVLTAPIYLSVIFTVMGYFSLGRVLEVRAFAVVAFFILTTFILVSFLGSKLLYTLSSKGKQIFFGFVLVSSLLVFISGFKIVSTFAEDVYTARNYALAFDQTLDQLRNYQLSNIGGEKQVIEIKQLPPSGLVKFWQVTGNPQDWENHVVPSFLKINAVLVAK